MLTIEVLDAVESRIPTDYVEMIYPCLSWKAVYWTKGRYHMESQEYTANAFIKKRKDYWYFYTGLVSRVMEYAVRKGEEVSLLDKTMLIPMGHPSLPGLEFRNDQLELIGKARKLQRGIILSPTGSGKTILQLGILSCLYQSGQYRSLILAHTIDLVQQTVDELIKFGFDNVQMIGGKQKDKRLHGDIIVSTIQSFIKIDFREYADYFAAVIIDEAHHVSKPKGTYGKVLSKMLAPLRLGFTATLPTTDQAQFSMEGILGPIIGELTIEEAVELDILAKPKIRLIKSEYNRLVRGERKYSEVYDRGVVYNRNRNKAIINVCKEYIDQGKTVLIMVQKIYHGEVLEGFARHHGVEAHFVRGSTDDDTREKIKALFLKKKIKCVIATVVWREGINIPTLDVVVNACGGKSELVTLQAIGRGLRKTKDKEEVIIVDIFDPSHPYLISHFGERVTLYMDRGWL